MPKKQSRRERLKAGLGDRTEASYGTRNDSGAYRDIFKDNLKFPIWKPQDGGHSIDILPYFAGEHDPRVKEGDPTYFVDLWVHGHVGPTEDTFVCPQKNNGFGGRCPVCEEIAVLRNKPGFDYQTNERFKDIKAKRRSIYFVLVQDSIEELEKGPQIFNGAYSQFEKQLSFLAKTPKTARGTSVGGFTAFSSPDQKEGKTIYFERENKGYDVSAPKFISREEDISDEILDKLTPLDETFNILTYEELKESLTAIPAKEEESLSDEEDSEDEMDQAIDDAHDERDKINRDEEYNYDDNDDDDEEEKEKAPQKRSKRKGGRR